jgi:hypothetical protein
MARGEARLQMKRVVGYGEPKSMRLNAAEREAFSAAKINGY